MTEITVGRTRQIAGRELVLSPGTYHTELHFDSVSLKSPEKIRFQYRMDDVDPVWLDADTSLTAVYTNVPLGTHFFHVRACNADGVWDPIGIAYRITQQPYVYETTWFRLSVLLAVALFLIGAYQLRLKQIAHQYNLRLDERVNERTRIARELHDTLLQSFHGLMLRFQSVQNMLPGEPAKAKESLGIAIDRAAKAIVESRDTVAELRSSHLGGNDLVQSLSSLGQELSIHQSRFRGSARCVLPRSGGRHASRSSGQSARRSLSSCARSGRQRISSRASLSDRSRHTIRRSNAETADTRRWCWDTRRDSCSGRTGGSLGFTRYEGAARGIGGKLEVWTELGQGTEVEVTIPAAIAYRKSGEDL